MTDHETHVTQEAHAEPHKHELPGEGTYFAVFLLLAILTLAELVTTYLPVVKVPLLLGLGAAKAWLVVQFYMHLRYDNRLLTYSFLIPVGLGILMAIFLQPLINSWR